MNFDDGYGNAVPPFQANFDHVSRVIMSGLQNVEILVLSNWNFRWTNGFLKQEEVTKLKALDLSRSLVSFSDAVEIVQNLNELEEVRLHCTVKDHENDSSKFACDNMKVFQLTIDDTKHVRWIGAHESLRLVNAFNWKNLTHLHLHRLDIPRKRWEDLASHTAGHLSSVVLEDVVNLSDKAVDTLITNNTKLHELSFTWVTFWTRNVNLQISDAAFSNIAQLSNLRLFVCVATSGCGCVATGAFLDLLTPELNSELEVVGVYGIDEDHIGQLASRFSESTCQVIVGFHTLGDFKRHVEKSDEVDRSFPVYKQIHGPMA